LLWFKLFFSPDGDDEEDDLQSWQLDLEYRDTVSSPYSYTIETFIGSLVVAHYEMADRYDGWKSTADIGGFAFLVVIIQAIVMILFDFFLDKDSKFLSGKLTPAQAGYAEIGSTDQKL